MSPRAPLPLPGLGPVSGLVRFGWRVRPVRVPALFWSCEKPAEGDSRGGRRRRETRS